MIVYYYNREKESFSRYEVNERMTKVGLSIEFDRGQTPRYYVNNLQVEQEDFTWRTNYQLPTEMCFRIDNPERKN